MSLRSRVPPETFGQGVEQLAGRRAETLLRSRTADVLLPRNVRDLLVPRPADNRPFQLGTHIVQVVLFQDLEGVKRLPCLYRQRRTSNPPSRGDAA